MAWTKEKMREYQKEWHRANKDSVSRRSSKRYRENKESILAKKKARYNTPDGRKKAKKYLATKEALQKGGQFVEHVDRDTLYRMWGGMCGICEDFITGDFHIDHRVPLSKGGQHGYVNCQPSHPSCNLKKHAKERG